MREGENMGETSWHFAVPDPTDISAPHFAALQERRIIVQSCSGCNTKRWYPKPACHNCWSFDSAWVEVPTQGEVHTWTRMQHAFWPAKKDDVPYQVAVVDLGEGVRVIGRVPMDYADVLEVGLPVKADFREVTPGLTLLYFQPR